MEEFPRIKRLPPYIFSITDALKREARARGEDIIDFGMGNPDQETPQHIVDKLTETVQRGDTHRYSQSKGIPRLRKAICNWYKDRFEVELDFETEAIVTLGSKEGIAHLAMAVLGPGDAVLVPNPSSCSSIRVCYSRCRCDTYHLRKTLIFLKNSNRQSRIHGQSLRFWCLISRGTRLPNVSNWSFLKRLLRLLKSMVFGLSGPRLR